MKRYSNDYEQMAKVINYLSEHYQQQPSLAKLAKVAGLSEFHFQRKFADWVGVTPKSFLQYLTYDNAKTMLAEGQSVLQVTNSVGLSGASRLHDLCVTLDSVSPGEIKRAGEGLVIEYGFAFSPFGECMVASSSRGIMQIKFLSPEEQEKTVTELQTEWLHAELQHNDQIALLLIQRLFNQQDNKVKPLRAYVKGTKFQLRVWSALLKIPPGKLSSYGELAKQIGQPTAARAVGSAVGKNPLAYLIPCHRVIRETGLFGDYRWGLSRKRMIIACESIR